MPKKEKPHWYEWAEDKLRDYVKPPSAEEKAKAKREVEERPSAAYGRKKQGAGGGFAIID